MTKTDLINEMASKASVSKKDAEAVLDALITTVTDELKKDSKVAVTGFGTFKVSKRKARTGVNPQKPTEKIQIPAMNVPKFTPGKTFKDAIR
ncbi:HU family DNA-binding protein [Patescibacteria group bacterium]|nr:HU family DNA-binding protein [Patescibacteria group bacterium]